MRLVHIHSNPAPSNAFKRTLWHMVVCDTVGALPMSKSMPVCEGSPGAEVGARPNGNSCSSHFLRSTDKNNQKLFLLTSNQNAWNRSFAAFQPKIHQRGWKHLKTIKFTNSKGREIFPSKQLPKTQAHVNF